MKHVLYPIGGVEVLHAPMGGEDDAEFARLVTELEGMPGDERHAELVAEAQRRAAVGDNPTHLVARYLDGGTPLAYGLLLPGRRYVDEANPGTRARVDTIDETRTSQRAPLRQVALGFLAMIGVSHLLGIERDGPDAEAVYIRDVPPGVARHLNYGGSYFRASPGDPGDTTMKLTVSVGDGTTYDVLPHLQRLLGPPEAVAQ